MADDRRQPAGREGPGLRLVGGPAADPAPETAVDRMALATVADTQLPIRFGREVAGDLEVAEQREWLVTNGIGGYGSGTVAGTITRGYHGLLVASLRPPVDRRLMLVKLDETLTYRGEAFDLADRPLGLGRRRARRLREHRALRARGLGPALALRLRRGGDREADLDEGRRQHDVRVLHGACRPPSRCSSRSARSSTTASSTTPGRSPGRCRSSRSTAACASAPAATTAARCCCARAPARRPPPPSSTRASRCRRRRRAGSTTATTTSTRGRSRRRSRPARRCRSWPAPRPTPRSRTTSSSSAATATGCCSTRFSARARPPRRRGSSGWCWPPTSSSSPARPPPSPTA